MATAGPGLVGAAAGCWALPPTGSGSDGQGVSVDQPSEFHF